MNAAEEIKEAEQLHQQAMLRAGLYYDYYGILQKRENNVHNLGVQPWLAYSRALIYLARQK